MQPEERVTTFICDFHEAHSQLMAQGGKGDFERWDALVVVLDHTHFVDHGGRELADVIDGKSPHTLEDESIAGIKRVGERVFIETHVKAKSLSGFYEYELREAAAGDWRIVRLREFLDAPDAPFMTARQRPRFDTPKIHPLRQVPAAEAHVDADKLFAARRSVELDDKVGSIEVRQVGLLNVTTGILVVGDLGYDPGVLSPLGQRVPPGRYPAAVAVAFERNAGLRVCFSDRKVARWHPADTDSGGHVVGVDAGNVAILDVAAIMTLKARDKERAFDLYARAGRQPGSQMLSLGATDDTVIADSGWGDGGYPVYWGVDADDKPAVLLVDFLLFRQS